MTLTPEPGESSAHLGTRLRVLRESRALSLGDLSRASGLTKGYLSKVEREIATPSTSALVLICDKLGISLGELFDTTTYHDVIHFTDRVPISLGGEGLSETLLTPRGERRVQVLQSVIEPGGGSGPEQYSLPSDVEFALVLSGQVSLKVEGEVHQLGEGDSITFSSQVPHSFRNEDSTRKATVLSVLAQRCQMALENKLCLVKTWKPNGFVRRKGRILITPLIVLMKHEVFALADSSKLSHSKAPVLSFL